MWNWTSAVCLPAGRLAARPGWLTDACSHVPHLPKKGAKRRCQFAWKCRKCKNISIGWPLFNDAVTIYAAGVLFCFEFDLLRAVALFRRWLMQKRKQLACDVADTCATHASCVHDARDADSQTENGSDHGHVVATFKCQFLIDWKTAVSASQRFKKKKKSYLTWLHFGSSLTSVWHSWPYFGTTFLIWDTLLWNGWSYFGTALLTLLWYSLLYFGTPYLIWVRLDWYTLPYF